MKLQIHCWGGFGSQLFAWFKAYKILDSYPNRQIVLVFHTSGVTERPLELNLNFPSINVQQVHDFNLHVSSEPLRNNLQIISALCSRKFKKALEVLGFVIFDDGDSRVKSWTLQIRSHYSHEEIPKETFLRFLEILKIQIGESENEEANLPAIQYRLGDLVSIADKSPISPDRFSHFLERLDAVMVFTDSPELVEDLFQEIPNLEICAVNAEPWETILVCAQRGEFLGTNSKLSIWIAILRAICTPELKTWMPKELSSNIKVLLGKEFNESKFEFY
jgi:hypothetical protein